MNKNMRHAAASFIFFIICFCINGCDFDTDAVCFPAPGSGGLTYDGTYFWLADGDAVWKITIDGHVAGFIPFSAKGLAYDGQYFWTGKGPVLQAFDTEGNEITSIHTPAIKIGGIVCDDNYFWVADTWTNTLYKLDASGRQLTSISLSEYELSGLTFDGSHLWVAVLGKRILSKRHLQYLEVALSGEVLRTINIGYVYYDGRVNGLAFDGEHLWSAGSAPNSKRGFPEICRHMLP